MPAEFGWRGQRRVVSPPSCVQPQQSGASGHSCHRYPGQVLFCPGTEPVGRSLDSL